MVAMAHPPFTTILRHVAMTQHRRQTDEQEQQIAEQMVDRRWNRSRSSNPEHTTWCVEVGAVNTPTESESVCGKGRHANQVVTSFRFFRFSTGLEFALVFESVTRGSFSGLDCRFGRLPSGWPSNYLVGKGCCFTNLPGGGNQSGFGFFRGSTV
jgi:hypothetical protein